MFNAMKFTCELFIVVVCSILPYIPISHAILENRFRLKKLLCSPSDHRLDCLGSVSTTIASRYLPGMMKLIKLLSGSIRKYNQN